ncbi:4355_t:CDS:2, partial [Dentiscutata heterogama]
KKESCDLQTKDAHIAKYVICKELLSSYESHHNIPSPTDPQIGPSMKAIIREQPYIDIVFKTLNISDNKEEVAKIESNSNYEKTIIDYSAPNIENEDKKEFEHINNLDNSFG